MQRIQGAVFVMGLAAMGCGTLGMGSTTTYSASSAAQVKAAAEAKHLVAVAADEPGGMTERAAVTESLAGTDCDLRLFVEQLPGGGRSVFGTDQRSLGASVVERVAGDKSNPPKVTNGVCIKRPGQPLTLPAGILVAQADSTIRKRFCSDVFRPATLVTESEPAGVAVQMCTWDGTFHSARPFTVTLAATKDSKVADFVEFARVYRNGDLMIAWNRAGDQPNPGLVVLPGESMTSGVWAPTHPPHLSSMDLRIIPRGDSVTVGVETEVRDDRERFRKVMTDAFGEAFDVALPNDEEGKKIRESLQCLSDELQRASAVIMHHVNADIPAPDKPKAGCTPLVDSGMGGTPLSDEYKKLKDTARTKAGELKGKAYAEIASYRDKVAAKIPEEKRKVIVDLMTKLLSANEQLIVKTCLLEIERDGSDKSCLHALKNQPGFPKELNEKVEQIVETIETLDRQVTATLRTVDEAFALADRLTDKTKEIIHDPNQQAQIFNAFVGSIQSQGDSFEPRRDNPPLMAGEQKIEMSYSDSLQGFMFAPWNAVPVRVKGDVQADLSAATALPFLDLVGFRFQWGRSRFADFRGAVGVGYVRIKDEAGNEKSAGAPNVSIGLGNFKAGVSYLLAPRRIVGEKADRVRVLVGADLFKLLVGDNVEVL